jgi:hypothetical protein
MFAVTRLGTTPFAKQMEVLRSEAERGFFYETWVRGENWFRVSGKATKCPRLRPEFVEEERREKTTDCLGGDWIP